MKPPEENLDALRDWLTGRYDLTEPIACRLLRSYTNDVYHIQTPSGQYVLKIYGGGWRTESEIAYEVALLLHLAARGLAVAGPISGHNGFINRVEDTDGYRYGALFTYAEGEKPQPPFTPDLYFAFGRALARMHELSAGFTTEHARHSLDLGYVLDAPLTQVMPLLAEPNDCAFLTSLAAHLRDRITEFAAQGLDWGPIHGDATLDNLHVTADGEVILYDFDSGGPGWRAADLQGWAMTTEAYRPLWEAFAAGYRSVRSLAPIDLQAAPYLTLLWDIWGLKIDLDNRILPQGEEKIQSYLAEQVVLLRERCVQLRISQELAGSVPNGILMGHS